MQPQIHQLIKEFEDEKEALNSKWDSTINQLKKLSDGMLNNDLNTIETLTHGQNELSISLQNLKDIIKRTKQSIR